MQDSTIENYAVLAGRVRRRRLPGTDGPDYECECGYRHILGYGHAPDELVAPLHGTLVWPCVCYVPLLRPCAERGCVVWTWWQNELTPDETWHWQHGDNPEAVLTLPRRMRLADMQAQVAAWFAACHQYEDAAGLVRQVQVARPITDPSLPSAHATHPDEGADVLAFMVWPIPCRPARRHAKSRSTRA